MLESNSFKEKPLSTKAEMNEMFIALVNLPENHAKCLTSEEKEVVFALFEQMKNQNSRLKVKPRAFKSLKKKLKSNFDDVVSIIIKIFSRLIGNRSIEGLVSEIKKYKEYKNFIFKLDREAKVETPQPLTPKRKEALKNQLLDAISKGDLNFKQKVEHEILSLEMSDGEALAIKDILTLCHDQPKILIEILKGAQVQIEGSQIYDRWKALPAARERISSHPHIEGTKQYGVAGPVAHEILFGLVETNGKTSTFFQLENTPWGTKSLKDSLKHTADAAKYVVTRKNIGPYGSSLHVDANPISLQMKRLRESK